LVPIGIIRLIDGFRMHTSKRRTANFSGQKKIIILFLVLAGHENTNIPKIIKQIIVRISKKCKQPLINIKTPYEVTVLYGLFRTLPPESNGVISSPKPIL